MVHGDGIGGLNSGTYDKSKVLDVKPLRCLAPVFPNQNNVNPQSSTPSSSPFVAASPFGGSVPSGYSPFYPFSPSTPQQKNRQTPDRDGPSYKKMKTDSVIEESEDSMSGSKADSFRDEGTSNGVKKKSSSQKKVKRSDLKIKAPPDGDSESVTEIRMRYDGLRRRISQLEEISGGMKRSDLKAGSIMMDRGMRTNTRKRTGCVPGVDVGDIFFFRFEICLVGLHTPTISGIDYMNVKFDTEEETLAVSIVSSGAYEDATDDKDMLVYSGQGGGVSNRKDGKGLADQKLERGNLALERSLRRGNEVRVIRGMKDLLSPSSKVYFYDGLYKIHESWTEKAKSGCNVFKYKLLRIPGQPEAYGIWKSVQQWRNNINSRPGLILPDLTSGAEKLPVSLVNDIDSDKGPTHFTYSTCLKYSKSVSSLKPSSGCGCHGPCQPGDRNCACIVKNGGQLPHTLNGVLVIRKHFIHECGPSCKCYPTCKNLVSQSGLKIRLEVFKTIDKGWGLRSWDAIRAGTFICEYAGEVIHNREGVEEDDYVFDSSRDIDYNNEWNYTPELLDEEKHSDLNETGKPPVSLLINAKNTGNVARFMNHGCSPNVFWQPVLYDHDDEAAPHIVFYAIKHIPPMTELTYDYGRGGKVHKRRLCFCRSSKCRGYFH